MKTINLDNYGDGRIKMLVWGLPFTGKTSLAKTLPGKTLVLSFESGVSPLRDCKNIDVIEIQFDDAGKKLPDGTVLEKLNKVYEELQKKDFIDKYDNIFIDTLSEISSLIELKVKKEFPDARHAMPMWGAYKDQMIRIIKMFRDISYYNVVFNCNAVKFFDKDNNQEKISIKIKGSLRKEILEYFDEILFYHHDGKQDKRILIAKSDSLLVKNRYGGLEKENEADLGKIIDLLLKTKKEGKVEDVR